RHKKEMGIKPALLLASCHSLLCDFCAFLWRFSSVFLRNYSFAAHHCAAWSLPHSHAQGHAARAASSSAIVANRSAGFFAMHFATTSDRSTGTSGFTLAGGTGTSSI